MNRELDKVIVPQVPLTMNELYDIYGPTYVKTPDAYWKVKV